jgi:hypothetical protein
MKRLAIITALLVGSASLALAQNGPPGPGVNPAPNFGAQSSAPQTGTATRVSHRTTHHKKMYMSAKTIHHKGSKLNPASKPSPQKQ